ncbi:MAG: hypothetical protein QXI39_08470 [Candidatus Bathyarchaeia archaeon]
MSRIDLYGNFSTKQQDVQEVRWDMAHEQLLDTEGFHHQEPV